jgi:hypothetical protein
MTLCSLAHGAVLKSAVILVSWAPLSTRIFSMPRHCWSRNWCWTFSGFSGCAIASEKSVIVERTLTTLYEGLSRPKRNIDVRGRPVQQKFGGTGSKIYSKHQRCQSRVILGIWIGACFQKELNKVEVGRDAREACLAQGR